MLSENILVGSGILLAGILVEQAGLGPPVRRGAWTVICIGAAAYLLLRVLPALRG